MSDENWIRNVDIVSDLVRTVLWYYDGQRLITEYSRKTVKIVISRDFTVLDTGNNNSQHLIALLRAPVPS